MATCAVSGTIYGTDGTAIASVEVSARVVAPVLVGSIYVVPEATSVYTTTDGTFTITLQQSIDVVFSVRYPPTALDSARQTEVVASIPATTTANFHTIIGTN